jgi:hypothetical protein
LLLCLSKDLLKLTGSVSKSILALLQQLVLYLLEKLLALFLPARYFQPLLGSINFFFDCAMHPMTSFSWFLNDEKGQDSGKVLALLHPIRQEMFANFQLTFFWLAMSVIPAKALDALLSLVAMWFPPLLLAIEGGRKIINKVLQKLAFHNADFSVGDMMLFLSKQGGISVGILMALKELYGWVCDVGGCFIAKVKILFQPDDEKAKLEYACCFRDFVADLKKALRPSAPNSVLSAMARGTVNVGRFFYNGYNSVTSLIHSDRRLKTLLLSTPLFCRRFDQREICFYLFEWNRRALSHLTPAERGGFRSVHVGVLAQQVQTQFPEAVEEDAEGFLQVNLMALPRPLTRLLAVLDGRTDRRARSARSRQSRVAPSRA